jgi:hypothetical protein
MHYAIKTWGRSGDVAPPFLTSALYGGMWSASCLGRFAPGEIAHWDRGLGGPQSQSGCYREVKNLALPGIKSGTSTHREQQTWKKGTYNKGNETHKEEPGRYKRLEEDDTQKGIVGRVLIRIVNSIKY